MNWPGENLLIKLWETLADKGVGGLLKPWQIRREGIAQTDVKRHEVLALAEAEREAQEIRAGRLSLSDSKFAISLTTKTTIDNPKTNGSIHIATQTLIADTLRKEINVAKAITHAEDELKNDTENTVPDENIDSDWLYRWRDYAGTVSSDELQVLWGRILAGEVKSPGTYSYRLLELVRNLNRNEAILIEKISPFVITDFIVRQPESILEAEGITFNILLDLQELGIVAGVEAIGLNKQFPSSASESFIKILLCYGRGILVEHSDPKKKLDIGVYVITTLGKQVIRLGKFKANNKYLEAVALEIVKKGFKVSLCDYVPAGKDQVRYFNKIEVANKTQQSK
jgi:uncharacterized protein YuzE